MSSHLLDSVVLDEKSSVAFKVFSLFLKYFCYDASLCLSHLEFILLNLQINVFLYICQIFAIISWILFLLLGLFPFLLVLPLWMLMYLMVSFTYLRLYSLLFLSLFLRLPFVGWAFTNSSCKHQSAIESFQWIWKFQLLYISSLESIFGFSLGFLPILCLFCPYIFFFTLSTP